MSDTTGQIAWRATVRYAQPFNGGVGYGSDTFTVMADENILTAHRAGLQEFSRRNPGAHAKSATYTRVDTPAPATTAHEAQPSLWGEGGAR